VKFEEEGRGLGSDVWIVRYLKMYICKLLAVFGVLAVCHEIDRTLMLGSKAMEGMSTCPMQGWPSCSDTYSRSIHTSTAPNLDYSKQCAAPIIAFQTEPSLLMRSANCCLKRPVYCVSIQWTMKGRLTSRQSLSLSKLFLPSIKRATATLILVAEGIARLVLSLECDRGRDVIG